MDFPIAVISIPMTSVECLLTKLNNTLQSPTANSLDKNDSLTVMLKPKLGKFSTAISSTI